MKIQTLYLLIPLLFAGAFSASPQLVAANPADDVEVIAIRMYADWCGYCKELDGKLDEVKHEFADSNVWFTYFDVTDEFAQTQTRYLADKLNLSHIYEQYSDRTGLMLLVNPKDGQVIEEITSDISEDDLVSQIRKFL